MQQVTNSTLRFYIYLRKSSESEERQELSIYGQERELLTLVDRRQLQIVGTPFKEERSAKEPGRPVFDEMVKRINRGLADGIICWKSDRLARNPIDGGRLIYDLGKHRIKAIVTPDRTYTGTAEDKLLLSINFGMATKYSDDLSDNVRRGNRDALTRGLWPGLPKLGYLRDAATRRLVPDPARFPPLASLWQRIVAGERPLDVLAELNGRLGFRTRHLKSSGGKPLSKSALYRILRDPFYIGLMIRAGETYSGTHLPMVSRETFEDVAAILDGRRRPSARPQHLKFTYGGLIRCVRCSAGVTAKNTVNRYGRKYTYYYCCRKERRYGYCPEAAVQESVIDRQLGELFARLRPPAKWCQSLMGYLERRKNSSGAAQSEARRRIDEQLSQLEKRSARLRELLLRGVLSEDDYAAERSKVSQERHDLAAARDRRPAELVEPLANALAWLNKAQLLFERGSADERRDLVAALTWNLTLGDKKLNVHAKKTTAILGGWTSFGDVWGWRDHVSTFLETDHLDEDDQIRKAA